MSEVQPQVTTTSLAGVSVQCPLCDYDMRGLIECRCPECGFTSTWEELTDPTRARHPYLFEHHPERNVWSAVKTFLGGLRPRRFWADLYPTQPSRPGRLVLYGLICSGLVVALFLLTSGGFLAIERSFAPSAWNVATMVSSPFVLIAFVLAPALWSWLTFMSLLVYQKSLRRSRLRTVHLLRVAIYSFDFVAWIAIGPLVVPLFSNLLLMNSWLGVNGSLFDATQMAATAFPFWCVLMGIGSYRLWLACRGYLHFNYALPAVIASQTIVFLAACCIVFVPDLYFGYVPRQIYMMIARSLPS